MAVERIISEDLMVVPQGSGGVMLRFRDGVGVGEKGEKGDDGEIGPVGPRGEQGPAGADGESVGIIDGGESGSVYGPGGVINSGDSS